MKLTKLIVVTALILGAAEFQATAQGNIGLNVTVNARFTIQNTNQVTNARTQTVTVSRPIQRTFNTADLLRRLAVDENLAGNFDGTSFPRGSRLVATNGGFVVISGGNVLADVSNIISIGVGTNVIFSGATDTNNLARPSQTRIVIGRLIFDDTGINTTDGLRFYLQGILTQTTTDTVPNVNTGIFTESTNASMPSSAGEGNLGVGSDDERQIITSGSFFASGRGQNSL
jgi:hypothetical protein